MKINKKEKNEFKFALIYNMLYIWKVIFKVNTDIDFYIPLTDG